MRLSLKQLLIATAVASFVLGVLSAVYVNGRRLAAIEQSLEVSEQHRAELQSEVDAVRALVLKEPPRERRSVGRKPSQVDRDGWPARSIVVHQENFGPLWPFRESTATVTGTLFGLCLVSIDGQTWALDELTANSGYPLADARVLKHDPSPRPGDLADVTQIRDVALRLVEQLKVEHVLQPYAIP